MPTRIYMHHRIPQDSKSRRSAAQSPATSIQLRASSGCRGSGVTPAAWRRSPRLHCCPFMACASVHLYNAVHRYLTCDPHIMHCRSVIAQVHRRISCVALMHERPASSSRREHRSPRIRSTGSMACRSMPGGCGFRLLCTEILAWPPMPTPSRGSAGSSAATPSQ